jgi:hypothetical protein
MTYKSKPQISLREEFESVDWGRTIMACQQQRRRRRQSLIVVDSGACKEAHRFCVALFFMISWRNTLRWKNLRLTDNYHTRTLVTPLT